jgi:hypothetical protein
MKIAFAGTGYINKIHAQAAKNLGLDLVAVINHKRVHSRVCQTIQYHAPI